ncbi:N-6 DNA methylase [Klebsiella variicola]|uniref:N-6 DNA methylase n=1 Tax=Klebsiella variicola TaxID=244366 RepID=UPI00155F5488|nr:MULTISPECIES: N-6 DNA methylase [Klebsiella]MDR6247098.1 hypothetical protein [Klebsiella variicola]MDR6252371.1 hypothetical protein [Klebsiella variicola]MDR6257813.1 hypothetical protein [Klebsiella sp. SORGH_AS_0826]MDR6271482.1 hypothetical protein [Klebsiella variicola]MDR6278803.1 hypothetical protein [Klebsiella variicola]
MIQLNNHNEQLKSQFESTYGILDSNIPKKELVSLDSIDLVLRQCLNIEEMREAGSFFTGQELSTFLINKFEDTLTFSSVVYDPTCGAGNLLIECSRKLNTVDNSLKKTLNKWGEVLRGFDIHSTFIEAAKLRLILEALSRGVTKDCDLHEALECFKHIKLLDVTTVQADDLKEATHIVMNPPFTLWNSPKVRFWKNGKVNAAGVVFEQVIRNIPQNCYVSAILPDVLRSGSRYENWRKFASNNISGSCQLFGKFNNKTDVDVFILSGLNIISDDNYIQWFTDSESKPKICVSNLFDVCVGSLVAYRDPPIGNNYPYIHPKNAPAWECMREFHEYRRYSGKVYTSPLVVVRRTSSPSDKFRAVGTLIESKEPVAIENHLIVLVPKDGLLETCKMLLHSLKCQETNDYFNNRIRLRHLTVGIVKDLPLNKAAS